MLFLNLMFPPEKHQVVQNSTWFGPGQHTACEGYQLVEEKPPFLHRYCTPARLKKVENLPRRDHLARRYHRRSLVFPPNSLRWSLHCLRKSAASYITKDQTQVT